MAEGINVTAAPPQHPQAQSQPSAEPRPVEGSKDVEVQPTSAEASKVAVEQAAVSVEELQAAIDQLNEFMKQGQRSLAFSVDDQAEQVVVSVLDKETNELVRQIPSPEALELKKHLEGVIGLLFNDKA